MPLAAINRVTFYKIDEITTDMICCEIATPDGLWTYHEEREDWGQLIGALEALPNFAKDWSSHVNHPPFAASTFVAYERPTP